MLSKVISIKWPTHWVPFLIVRLLLFSGGWLFCSDSVFGQATQVNLAKWTFEQTPFTSKPISSLPVNSQSEVNVNFKSSYLPNGPVQGSYSAYPGNHSIAMVGWDGGLNTKWWYTIVNTVGYGNLKISSQQRSPGLGPSQYRLVVSIDGVNWTTVKESIPVGLSFSSGGVDKLSLPSQCENQSSLIIRWVLSSYLNANGDGGLGAAAANYLDNIYLIGDNLPFLSSPLLTTVCSGSNFSYTPSGTQQSYSWSRASVAGIAEAPTSGSAPISEILTNTTSSPVTVNYVFKLVMNGATNTQTLQVKVNPSPSINLSPESLTTSSLSGALSCEYSGSCLSEAAVTQWEWTRENEDRFSLSTTSGSSSPLKTIIHVSAGSSVSTRLKFTARSSIGCQSDRYFPINFINQPAPYFTIQPDVIYLCVSDIQNATSNGGSDIVEERPEYFDFKFGDTILDLSDTSYKDDYTDISKLILHWRISMANEKGIYTGIGEPSLNTFPIRFEGSATDVINHTITYWLEDEQGNLTPDELQLTRIISIHPRPPISSSF